MVARAGVVTGDLFVLFRSRRGLALQFSATVELEPGELRRSKSRQVGRSECGSVEYLERDTRIILRPCFLMVRRRPPMVGRSSMA